jgi:hypothetical protein
MQAVEMQIQPAKEIRLYIGFSPALDISQIMGEMHSASSNRSNSSFFNG